MFVEIIYDDIFKLMLIILLIYIFKNIIENIKYFFKQLLFCDPFTFHALRHYYITKEISTLYIH